MHQLVGVLCVVVVLAIMSSCQKTPAPAVSAPTPATSAPSDAPTILNLNPGPGETIELGGEGTVELDGSSAPPTAEPTPGEGTPVP